MHTIPGPPISLTVFTEEAWSYEFRRSSQLNLYCDGLGTPHEWP